MSETRAPEPAAEIRGDRATPVGLPSAFLLGLAVLGLAATLIGRSIAPALPGSAAGIEPWIRAAELGGAILSVNLLVGGCAMLVWLSLSSMLSRELPASYRVVIMPAVAIVIVLTVASYRVVLYPTWLLWLSLISAGLAMLAVPRALVVPLTRGPGLLLGIGGASSLLEVGARVTAIRAGELALASVFDLARGISTVAFGLDVLALALVLGWIGGRRPRVGFIVMGCAFALSGVVAWGAVHGVRSGASPWMVIAARSLGEMTRHPTPLVQPFVRFSVEVMTLFMAAAVLVVPGKARALAAAVSLALLAGGATDIPLCAMMLALAALTVPLASLERLAVANGTLRPPSPAEVREEVALPSPVEPSTVEATQPLGEPLGAAARDGALSQHAREDERSVDYGQVRERSEK